MDFRAIRGLGPAHRQQTIRTSRMWRGTSLCCRAGELSAKELEELMVIVSNPRTFKIPDWFLNRQKDHKDGRFSQLTSSALDTKLREDLERLKKIRYVLH